MALARWEAPITDAAGNLVAGATVTVRREGPGSPLASIYEDRDGDTPLANPFTASSGIAGFHVRGGAFRITATLGLFTQTRRFVAIGTGGETDFGTIFLPMGAWSSVVTYQIGEVVTHQDGGNPYSFISQVADNLDNEPLFDGGVPDLADTNWQAVGLVESPGVPAIVTGTSTTSRTPGFGSQAFTTQLDLGWKDGQRLRAASDDGTKIIEGPATYDAGSGALTITCDYFKGSGAHADWNISIAGEPGQSFAFSLTWDEDNTDSDPGPGDIKADSDDLSAATELYIDDLDRFGNAIAASLLTAGAVDNTIKADITLQSEGGNARADFTVDIVADESGYVRFGIDDHSGATGFTAGTKILLSMRLRSNKGTDGSNGLDGVDYGLPFTFRTKTDVEVPDNLGDFNLDHGTLGSVTKLVISKFTASAGNPDTVGAIPRWWAGGSTSDRARVLIKNRADESDFIAGTISGAGTYHDEATDWYEIPFTSVTGPGIPAGAVCSIEVTPSGAEGIISGGVDSFNGRSGAVSPVAGDYDASEVSFDNATSGLAADTVEEAINEVEDRVDDLETNSFDKTTDDLDDLTAGTTNKHFTDTEKTKLAGVETGADVTDAGNVAAAIHGATNKATPVDADRIPLTDSAASNVLKYFTFANLKTVLASTFASLSGAVFTGAIQTTTIELGHATQNTLSASGGVLSVEGIPHYPGIPVQDISAAYPIVLADAQTCLRHPSSDNNARTFTIPANGSIPFPVGTCITFRNRINVLTIAITTDTLRWAPTDATGSRQLAAGGICTILKEDSTTWVISGVGLT